MIKKSTRCPSGCFNHKNFNYKSIYNETFCGKYNDFILFLRFAFLFREHESNIKLFVKGK